MCNEHHVIWHELAGHRKGDPVLTGDEVDRYMDLIGVIMKEWYKVPEQLQEQYLDVVTEMVDTIEANLETHCDQTTRMEMEEKQSLDLEVIYED